MNKGKTYDTLMKEIEDISKEKEEGLRRVEDQGPETKYKTKNLEPMAVTSAPVSTPETKNKEKSEIAELKDAFKSWVLLNKSKPTPQEQPVEARFWCHSGKFSVGNTLRQCRMSRRSTGFHTEFCEADQGGRLDQNTNEGQGSGRQKNENSFDPSYILMRFEKHDLPILIDTGASYYLINKELVLLGMNGCKSLKFRLYYDKNILSYRGNSHRGLVQLHSRDTIYDKLVDWMSEDKWSEYDTKDEEGDYSQDEIVPMYYASLESEIKGIEKSEVEELTSPAKIKDSIPAPVKLLVEKYRNLFSIDEFSHPKIKDAVFEITLPAYTSPPPCYLRRYSQKEK
ncbi:hypothetical protein AYI69_g9221 [Smittium culicis]|uniref:Uncharacterized protein n=1 Tax=Smittium culicis TaxID=133412 RepID=A0A1R1XE57_9FUNG|nr:hypothetical protein AYI69_g9221 [Smittium culicis]